MNWIFVYQIIRYSIFELFYKQNYILSIELSLTSWNTINWEKEIESHENLLIIKIYQLDEWMIKEMQVILELEWNRKENKIYFDQNKNIQSQSLKIDDFILIHNIKIIIIYMIKYKFDNK